MAQKGDIIYTGYSGFFIYFREKLFYWRGNMSLVLKNRPTLSKVQKLIRLQNELLRYIE